MQAGGFDLEIFWRIEYGDLMKVSKEELLKFATEVDEMVGHFFWPPR